MSPSESTRVLGTAPEESPTSACLVGRVLSGKFLVGDVIGEGGSSTVYGGWHNDLDCPIAIKVLNRAVAEHRALNGYFVREASVTARLVGPHAVHVYDRGVLEDGTPYTVLEYLRGQTLQALLDEVGHLPTAMAVELALQVCMVLVEAHSQGVAHCDLKPENLFLSELADGRRLLKVIDFGTARGEHAPEYVWTSCIGTPGYMAPEQIQTPDQVDYRADIWALGVVLFRMVSGSLPFEGSRSARMVATVNDEPGRLSALAQHLPALFQQIVDRCLEKDPAARFQSAEELASALRTLRRQLDGASRPGRTEPARPTTHNQPVPRSGVVTRNKTPAAATNSPARTRLGIPDRVPVSLTILLAFTGAILGAQVSSRWVGAPSAGVAESLPTASAR